MDIWACTLEPREACSRVCGHAYMLTCECSRACFLKVPHFCRRCNPFVMKKGTMSCDSLKTAAAALHTACASCCQTEAHGAYRTCGTCQERCCIENTPCSASSGILAIRNVSNKQHTRATTFVTWCGQWRRFGAF